MAIAGVRSVSVSLPPTRMPGPFPNNAIHVDFMKGKRLPVRPVPWPIAVGTVVTGAMLTYRLDQDPRVILPKTVVDPGFSLSADERLLRAALDGVILAKAQGDVQAVEEIKDGWVALAGQGVELQHRFLEAVRFRYPMFSDKIHRLFFAQSDPNNRYDLLRRVWLASGADADKAQEAARRGILPDSMAIDQEYAASDSMMMASAHPVIQAKDNGTQLLQQKPMEEKPPRQNCMGTALYLTGLIEEDSSVDSEAALAILEQLNRLDSPIPGCLIVFKHPTWKHGYIHHMGVVVTTSPPIMTHRFGERGELKTEPVNTVSERYARIEREHYGDSEFDGFDIEYYSPSQQNP